ncbi:MAG: TonB-dependent receptor, partial [Bacteroidota bacterium]
MKKIIGIIFIGFALLILSNPIKANNSNFNNADDDKPGIIKGLIIDVATDQPMEYANVAIYNKVDSSLISGGITNQKGEFEINGMTYGEYYLEANFIGFDKSKVVNINLDRENPLFDAGSIILSAASTELGAIDIVADKAAVEYKLDKKIVNVSQVLSAAGGTAVDVLENTPSVQVDIEGNVSLRGSSNFTVLIDGRPSVLSGSDALRQIPASALENIEIITNPSAKYEPDGNSGIINLVMKKNSMQGINGIVNASVGSRDKYRGDITLNYRTQKINWFVGADYRDETSYGNWISSRETFMGDTTGFLDINGGRDFIRGGYNFKSGIDFFISDKTTVTISGQVGNSKNDRSGGGNTHEYTLPQSVDLFSV